ncbi:MAG: hypothetical protein CYG59_08290 [Chloroflexi bacterium]|nr:MAG: hypothetical protein CYG59_08290 [Chloroflexota bacterium]
MSNRFGEFPSIGIPNIPDPEGLLPRLPEPIPDPTPDPLPLPQLPQLELQPFPFPRLFPPLKFRSLREGCYLMQFTPKPAFPLGGFVHYDGTMRIERDGLNTIASGDLYLHRWYPWPVPPVALPGPLPHAPLIPIGPLIEPNPAQGIPVFPRARYRYYLRVTQILEFLTLANSFTLGFERYLYNHSSHSWTNEGLFTAQMSWTAAPAGYPSSDYLTGQVKDSTGTAVGQLSMGWVSPFLRKATIEIDRVAASEAPLNNGLGLDIARVYRQVGWDVTVVESQINIAEPSGPSWSDAEMHAEMLARRDAANLDAEWRYHVLCVRELDSTSRGIMYDAFGGDSNNIPREGMGIASHWVTPDTLTWGTVRNMRFGLATAPYFRTVIHELGHAHGLYHNTVDMGFMNTTDVIAASATPGTFPANIQWSYATEDAKRMRHAPDPWVRPGMIPFGQPYASMPISPNDLIEEAHGLALKVTPLLESVPLGAPVRLEVELYNASDRPLPVPHSLSLKGGHVRGKVVDASGQVRTFWPIVRCIEDGQLDLLAPEEALRGSMTLLRGAQGALFPSSGAFQVIVEASWEINGMAFGLAGTTTVLVTPSVDQDHANAALQILSTPDALLTLALGGDHLADGVAAIRAGITNPVLRPHFAIVEAKRVGQRFRERAADLAQARKLLADRPVLSDSERKRANELTRVPRRNGKQRHQLPEQTETVHPQKEPTESVN